MNSQPSFGEFSSTRLSENGTRLILSVDDEPAILLTRHKILEKAGYEVLSAADGEQALLLFSKHPVCLVLLDYLMPGIDGGMVAHEMKRSKPGVPIFMVSASPIPPETLGCVDGRIDKGDGVAELLEKIAQLLVPLSTRNQIPSLADDSRKGAELERGNGDGAKL